MEALARTRGHTARSNTASWTFPNLTANSRNPQCNRRAPPRWCLRHNPSPCGDNTTPFSRRTNPPPSARVPLDICMVLTLLWMSMPFVCTLGHSASNTMPFSWLTTQPPNRRNPPCSRRPPIARRSSGNPWRGIGNTIAASPQTKTSSGMLSLPGSYVAAQWKSLPEDNPVSGEHNTRPSCGKTSRPASLPGNRGPLTR